MISSASSLGKQTQNSFVERFNRDYILGMYAFRRLSEVRKLPDNWIGEYNEERPHDLLDNLTPREFLAANSTWRTLNGSEHNFGSYTGSSTKTLAFLLSTLGTIFITIENLPYLNGFL